MQPESEPVAVDLASTLLAATLSSSIALASSTSDPSSGGDDGNNDNDQGDCELLGPFALLVQLALGGLALLALVYKRWRERPQRPVKIWFFDASKQVFGSVLVHGANVFMSMLTSGHFSITELDTPPPTFRLLRRGADADEGYVPNPCSWYLLNLAIDTTLGIPILIILLRIVTGLVALTPFGQPAESIQSGNYGSPPKKWWWFKQSIIYFIGLFGMKICVLVLFLLCPWISRIGDWALGWTEGNEKLQIAFVMMIFPLIMNGMQYYIIDSFIKLNEQNASDHERLPSEDPDDTRRRGSDEEEDALARVLHDTDGSDDGDEEVRLVKANGRSQQRLGDEYDPDLDGEFRTEVASGSSSRPATRHAKSPTLHPTPDLYPKE